MLFALVTLVPSAAYSATFAYCPPAQNLERWFRVDVDNGSVACLEYGDDNIQGDNDDLTGDWEFIDKDENNNQLDSYLTYTGHGTTSGTFTIDPAVWDVYGQIAIAFKTGANKTPEWAAFELFDDVLSGEWLISSNAISHINLYGMGEPDRDVQAVPEPASMLLVGAGLSWAARRRLARKAGKA